MNGRLQFLNQSILIQSRARGYRYMYQRPADIARTVRERHMVCEMGSFLDCYLWHQHVDELLAHASQAHKIEYDEQLFLYVYDMASAPIPSDDDDSFGIMRSF